jgi:hypothetical protein
MIIGGVAAAALLSGGAQAAPRTLPSKPIGPSWLVLPTDTGCRVDLELVGSSGGVTPVSLISDGELVSLRFFKEALPTRAFLPIRVDKARYSNLMLRGADGSGELVLSEETEAALRKGGTLGVAWLTEEPLSVSLGGSEQGLQDLRVCGAQAADRHRERTLADQTARDRAEADARAKALNDAQLAAVQAQTAAAEAQRRQVEETAERQRRVEAAQAERVAFESRQRAYEEERRRSWERQRAYEDEEEERWAPPPRAYPARRYYSPY